MWLHVHKLPHGFAEPFIFYSIFFHVQSDEESSSNNAFVSRLSQLKEVLGDSRKEHEENGVPQNMCKANPHRLYPRRQQL